MKSIFLLSYFTKKRKDVKRFLVEIPIFLKKKFIKKSKKAHLEAEY